MVSSNNVMVFNILMCRILAFLKIKSAIFLRFPKVLSVFDIRPFSSARKPIPRSDRSYCMVFCFNGFNLSTFRSFLIEFVFYLFFLASVDR